MINITDTAFEIFVTPLHGRGLFKIQVEVFYQSETTERYRLTGGKKSILLEKRIQTQHSWKNWRVLDVNFEFKIIDDWTIPTLHRIYKLIDEKRFGRRIITYRLPAERRSG